MLWNWNTATVVAIKDMSSTVRSFLLRPEITQNNPTSHQAGQFITLDLPISERRRERWRSYSIANAANDDGTLELCIARLPNGRGTTYLFEQITVGSTITYKGPDGNFLLPHTQSPIVMICTGTGVAPFRAMLQELFQTRNNHLNNTKNSEPLPQNIHLIIGTRYTADILYLDEWKNITQQHTNIRISFALSREPAISSDIINENSRLNAVAGYVHQLYTPEISPNTQYLLCGWQAMLDEARKILETRGVPKENILYELYG